MKKKYLTVIASVLIVSAVGLIMLEASKKVLTTNSIHNEKAPIILLDAGHGGVDGGAVSKNKILEKDLNLEIALKFKPMLCFFGFQVLTTRETDVSIHDESAKSIRQKKVSDLHNRLSILEESDADYLISIHQNMFEQSKYRGTQVFFGGNNSKSEALAENIQDSVKAILQNENQRKVKKATKDIYFLYQAKKPAVIIECGFMSNAAELELLCSTEYQKKMCFSILKGISMFEL